MSQTHFRVHPSDAGCFCEVTGSAPVSSQQQQNASSGAEDFPCLTGGVRLPFTRRRFEVAPREGMSSLLAGLDRYTREANDPDAGDPMPYAVARSVFSDAEVLDLAELHEAAEGMEQAERHFAGRA